MIKIHKENCMDLQYKEYIAELYICNFNGKITYKYVDKNDGKIRGKSCSNVASAIRSMKKKYNLKK